MRISCWIPKATNTHTLRICNTYCFSKATMVVRTRLIVTLCVHCPSCGMFLSLTMWYFFISHTIGPTDLLHPSPAPHFKTLWCFWSTSIVRSVQVSASHTLQICRCTTCITTHFFKTRRWMGWVASFSSHPLNPQARSFYYPIKWEAQKDPEPFWALEGDAYFLSMPGIELRFLRRPRRGPVANRLHYRCSCLQYYGLIL
jgi:hypothetical protein